MKYIFGECVKNRIKELSEKGYLPKHTLQNLDKEAQGIVKLLLKTGLKLATAESCTGGMISQFVTSVPNASQIFDMGVCTYANSAKEQLLNVSHCTLEEYGAVSRKTAIEMARGIKALAKSDIGVAVTGIAGPTGATADKPIGTVYCGVAYKEIEFACLLRLFELENCDRDALRKYTCLCVFEILHELIHLDNE